MNTMIQLYAAYRETLEKQSMGFRMSAWDHKLLKYGVAFEERMMDLAVNIPLEAALDLGWRTLAECFLPEETGIPTQLIDRFWPADVVAEHAESDSGGDDGQPAAAPDAESQLVAAAELGEG